MGRGTQLWTLPWIAVVIYPGLILSFDWAINDYHQSGSLLMAVSAVLVMLLAGSTPVLAARSLLIMRNEVGPAATRGILYLMFATPALFPLTVALTRIAGVRQHYGFVGVWVALWLALGLLSYVGNGQSTSAGRERPIRLLRRIHGVAALCLLLGFLIAHLVNHNIAVWSVELHGAVLKWLRVWYRSELVEPVLLALLLVMIGTGAPMVLRYSRQRMDVFRVLQTATGIYTGVFICSHVFAVIRGRSRGLETDWLFAAGPDSLLNGPSLLSSLIPYYIFGTLAVILHVACGVRIVLLQHGVSQLSAQRAVYRIASAGVVVTVLITAALLGFHAAESQ